MFSVFKNINRFAGKSKRIDSFAVFCAKYLIYILVATLFIISLFLNNFNFFLYPLISGLFSAFVINWLIYIFYKRERPAKFSGSKILIRVPKNPSFPSRHAALSFGLSFYLFFYNPLLAILFLLASCLVGIGRVFCGVHWFSDVLAGAAVGFASSFIIYTILYI